jgi:hypothetical protein
LLVEYNHYRTDPFIPTARCQGYARNNINAADVIINSWTALTGILPERIKAEHEDDILKTKLGCCARLEPQKDGVIAGEKRKLALREA